ncbi:MAG: DUF2179 domain-containing protein [Christensenellaceae bacterium]|nr:DUF2179 domain-containing protein [Christensenellaceae bacterium]
MNIWAYVLILVAKAIEVSFSTLRIMLINRGERKLGSILSFVEITLWVFIASSVLTDVQNDPIKGVLYAAGFMLGNYVGSLIEEKLAIGTTKVEAIVSGKSGHELAESIREKGFAVTVVEGKGMDDTERWILYMSMRRKDYKDICSFIQKEDPNAFVTAYNITPIQGGYGFIKNGNGRHSRHGK